MWFLGLDYSTQQLKAIVVDENANIIIEENVTFDNDLGHYKTYNGLIRTEDDRIVSPTMMWIEATDLLMVKLAETIDLSRIVVLSGSAQQHSTIFWSRGANTTLQQLSPELSLTQQLNSAFSSSFSPSWSDSSTKVETEHLVELLGGFKNYRQHMGSTLACRFAGPQILRLFKLRPELKQLTGSITLVSNGMCSIFAGSLMPMDIADAAGTGLTSCGSLQWNDVLCQEIDPRLEQILGNLVMSNTVVANISSYFVKRYQMNPKCKIVAFTGDNPSSVAAFQLHQYDVCLSLGTSDSLFTCSPKLQLHHLPSNLPIFMFPHPLDTKSITTLLCYKNGSHARNTICRQYCSNSWQEFSDALSSTKPGNKDVVGLIYDLDEITPVGSKGRYFAQLHSNNQYKLINENQLDKYSIIRALIEGQILSKYLHFKLLCCDDTHLYHQLIITGGASSNKYILQIIADIFNMDVITIATANSAGLGAVIRGVMATQNDLFNEIFLSSIGQRMEKVKPMNNKIYKNMLEGFGKFCEAVQ